MSTSYDSTSLPNKNLPGFLAQLRIKRDLKELEVNDGNSPIIFASEVDNNPFHIEASFVGPEDTPYANGIFLLDIKLSDQYPVRNFFCLK